MRRSFAAPLHRSLPVLALLASCAPGPDSDGQPEGERWVLQEDLRIGQFEGPPEYTFGSIRGVFAGPDNGLWVLESRIPELRLYDSAGSFVRRVGRGGSGPGEFSGFNVCAHAGPDGEIWVEDTARRWQRFDSTGVLLGSLPVTSTLGCGIRLWVSDSRLLAVNSEPIPGPTPAFRAYFVEYRMSPEMDRMIPGDTFPVPEIGEGQRFTYTLAGGGRITQIVPFTHRPWSIVTDGGFWITKGEGRYSIERLSLAGDPLLTIERSHSAVAVPDSIRQEAFRKYSPETLGVSVLSLSDLPTVYPPFEQLIGADDGRLWVLRRSGADVIELDVFAPTGEFLGTAATPQGFDRVSIDRITAEHIYGTYRDELDVPYAVRLAIRPG